MPPNPVLGAQGAQVESGYASESGFRGPRGPSGFRICPRIPFWGPKGPYGAHGGPWAPLLGPPIPLRGALGPYSPTWGTTVQGSMIPGA